MARPAKIVVAICRAGCDLLWVLDAALSALLEGYTRGYERSLGDGDSVYVEAADPLRAVVRASGGEHASVRLGVDPGGFFCGALFAALIAARQAGALAPSTRVGFVHVPPDQACSAAAAASPRLFTRAVNLEMIARVLGCLGAELLEGPGDRRVLITGFGPFEGVDDNPTEAFVGEPEAVDQMIGWAAPGARRVEGRRRGTGGGVDRFRAACGARTLEVVTGLVPLGMSAVAARAGRYRPLAAIEGQLRGLLEEGPLDAVIGLGVDSRQIARDRAPSPVFKIETQTWGWQRGAAQRPSEGAEPQRCWDLGAVMLRARTRERAALEFSRAPP